MSSAAEGAVITNDEKHPRDREGVGSPTRFDSFNAFVRGRAHDALLGGIILVGVVGLAIVAVVTGILA